MILAVPASAFVFSSSHLSDAAMEDFDIDFVSGFGLL
jgi:hypothetical protein